jgi:hypothetical protein
MIKPEWSWMVGIKSYICSGSNDTSFDDYQDHLEDGVDDFISTNKPTPYNDDDYDH